MCKSLVDPLSRIEIRNIAIYFRKLLGYEITDYVNVPKFFDALSLCLDKEGIDFDYTIVPDNHEIFGKDEEAFTDMSTGRIYIKESVMKDASPEMYKRGAFTLAHELGHYILHFLMENTETSIVEDDVFVPAFRDPEWQANTFASELLMPYEECAKLSPKEIRDKYHVSQAAAEVRYEMIRKEEEKNSKND